MKRFLVFLCAGVCAIAAADVLLVSAGGSGAVQPDNGVINAAPAIYQPWAVVPITGVTTTVTPSEDYVVYKLNVATNNTAVAVDVSGLDLAGQYATFEVEVTVSDADFSFTLPGTNVVTYIDGLPDITTAVDGTKHYFVFRAMATNDIVCNLWWTRTP